MNNCDLDRDVAAKQSDEGIGDIFISIGATNGLTLLFPSTPRTSPNIVANASLQRRNALYDFGRNCPEVIS
jgi:hypothetical protein